MLRFYIISRSHELISQQIRINPVTPDNLIDHLARLRLAAHQMPWSKGSRRSGSLQDRQRRGSNDRDSTLSLIMGHTAPARLCDRIESQEPDHSMPRRSIWARRIISTPCNFAAVSLFALVLIGALILMTALYPRLSLKHVHYNCFKGFEFLPAIIASGIFNIIIGPAYTILIWRFKDAYGIQRSMTTTFAIGIIAWAFTLAWRLNDRWTNHHISATLVYESQLLFAHTRFIVIPTIKSIRFHRLQKRAHHDTQRIHEDSFLGDVGSDRLAAAQTSKQSFMVALQNAHEHQKIERFAETCLCAELMSFLDVYLALKSCIYHEVLSSATAADFGNPPRRRPTPTRSAVVPSVVITEPEQIAPIPNSHLPAITANEVLTPTYSSRTSQAASQNPSQNRISRLLERVNMALPIFNQVSSSRSSRQHESLANGASTETSSIYVHVAADLVSLDVGIVETIGHAFPQYGASYSTPVPDSLRDKVNAVVNTFILPGSPWEINLSSRLVEQSQEFVGGSPMPCGLLDEIKNEVVDLLYSNVYIRYRQSLQ
ncbi:hypothetical protein H4S02_003279 [Coemansia sp. RSA 2611]|nr:hypothetical protein H4S02_003279 [Coemansia sp. RSA 2611]